MEKVYVVTYLHALDDLLFTRIVIASVDDTNGIRPFQLRRPYSRPQHSLPTSARIAERVKEAHNTLPVFISRRISGCIRSANLLPLGVLVTTRGRARTGLCRVQKGITSLLRPCTNLPAYKGAASSQQEGEEIGGEKEEQSGQGGGKQYSRHICYLLPRVVNSQCARRQARQ